MKRCNVLKINDEELVVIGRLFGYPGLDMSNKCWLILGMRVGTVVSVEVDPANRALVATVQPSIDFSDAGLDSMMILTGFASEQA